MISLIGDTDTKEEILNGFRLINRGDVAVPEKLDVVMSQHDVEYLTVHAPAIAGGYNYGNVTLKKHMNNQSFTNSPFVFV